MAIYDNLANFRHRKKEALILYKGGKCQICGYDDIRYLSAFCFHHRDPKEKDFEISSNGWSLERNKKEADKCDLLCVRCHAEEHEKEYWERRKLRADQQRAWLENVECKRCSKIFKPIRKEQVYCCSDCYHQSRGVQNKPSKEQLAEMIDNETWTAIGQKYGVSGNAVKKWAKKFELI